MSNTNTGGSAFPFEYFDNQLQKTRVLHGMTLRDYFAAHAPKPPDTWKANKHEAENIIQWRWAYADAMLEARQA